MYIFKKVVLPGLIIIVLVLGVVIAADLYQAKKRSVNAAYMSEINKDLTDRSIKLPLDKDETAEVVPVSAKNQLPVLPECLPEQFKLNSDLWVNGKQVKDFDRNDKISLNGPGDYSDLQGIPGFRGNNYRNSASFGTVDVKEEKLQQVWSNKIGYIDIWTGVGWTGQPSIVKWNDDVKNIMNITREKKAKSGLKEVIYATLDGNIYFMDLDDGKHTRPPIEVGAPHKGSVAVDPRGYPLLYAGQGIDEVKGKRVDIGYRIYSLIDQKMLLFMNGFDPFALRHWGAFDSNPVIDKKTDTLIECGENGILYTVKLNSNFEKDKGKISINPEIVKYRYSTAKQGQIGTENSPVVYKNFVYFSDNNGTLQCVDLNTLKPVWVRDLTDDSDSTMILEETGFSDVYLYTACEVDKQGAEGYSFVRKVNALTGALVWQKQYKCTYDTNTNGGTLASPVLGKHDIGDLVVFNIAKTGNKKNGGKLIAFDKKSGSEAWVVNLDNYCWSSPVDVYTKDGKSYLIVCDSVGNMFLIEGKSGKILHKLQLGSNVEGSPAVYEDMIVVGTRGQKIFGIRIR